ncbi:MAG: helix-turn-helix transcriptional regulator [Thermoleophilaceae bacterium]|nr:helix-turn-helix transcriptional regulator [Thermoleophilaceae bacterium]
MNGIAMQITNQTTEAATLEELGRRLRQARLNQGISQAELAARAGVSELTVSKMESGALGQARNFLRVLRALGLLANLDAAVPRAVSSPIAESDRGGRPRKRSPRSGARKDVDEWSWGEDDQ